MPKSPNAENLAPYGRIIGLPADIGKNKTKNVFHIVLSEEGGVGWRIAYLLLRDRVIDTLERHPDTYESFEPVSGTAVLFVATEEEPDEIKSFYLDKPVVLKKGIWHGIAAATEEAEIKITENAWVECEYRYLDYGLQAEETGAPSALV